jgi:uncharacterized membrane protein
LFVTGALHFATPRTFDRMIPQWMPGARRQWTLASGAAELLSGALLLGRRTARAGGWAAAATFVVVYPANVQAALDTSGWSLLRILLLIRLPLQPPLILWALSCRRE